MSSDAVLPMEQEEKVKYRGETEIPWISTFYLLYQYIYIHSYKSLS